MKINEISPGKNFPQEFNVIIEIPQYSSIKYEIDKDTGAVFVDRILNTAMHFPFPYGFIPQTLAADGDPVDVLIMTSGYQFHPASVIACRPIGVLMMADESGNDEKIIAVPISKIDPFSDNIQSYQDLSPGTTDKIVHFFESYKKLEKHKWVRVQGWEDKDKAIKIIQNSLLK